MYVIIEPHYRDDLPHDEELLRDGESVYDPRDARRRGRLIMRILSDSIVESKRSCPDECDYAHHRGADGSPLRRDWYVILKVEDPDDNVRSYESPDLAGMLEWGRATRLRDLNASSLHAVKTPTIAYAKAGTRDECISFTYTTCLPYALILLKQVCMPGHHINLYLPDDSHRNGYRIQVICHPDGMGPTSLAREDTILGDRLGICNGYHSSLASMLSIAVVEHPNLDDTEGYGFAWVSLKDEGTMVKFFADTISRAWYLYRRDKYMLESKSPWWLASLDRTTPSRGVRGGAEVVACEGCMCMRDVTLLTAEDVVLARSPTRSARLRDMHRKGCENIDELAEESIPLLELCVRLRPVTGEYNPAENPITEYVMPYMEIANKQVHDHMLLKNVELLLGRYTHKKYGYTFRFMT
ncbi:uncharacterized protein SPPG_00850 [Spizellomyces punctatus DAOM BR117]|uniref:Uncharacterized protein n=1 Tax=Spizellomyces punctatus (strain DAOM BR117) TaxID=645134 RepID=A0A0L0HV16_SPIPD|nr:uncharacterized protein SPPG_00850 [Spizellomyces punctatus DAOM BR117]KND05186.1 hypothetical protein SPPG_00850 [Spizellomyces punctatus DAOM BR117]|eukprot:XP_016613225.1 hypothetical protein SPPG_00850 [Spizellomyces punctatus DAOM BR117]